MIEFADASIGYVHAPVLEHVSLTIAPGDYVVIHGENGCGKSTLIKTALGIIEPLAGEVRNMFAPEGTGYLTQLNPLRFDFPATCAEIVQSGMRSRTRAGVCASESEECLWLALERMGIADLEHADYRRLSGGQRQRVLVARALASAQSLLVLDEPTNELDAQTVQALFQLLKQLNAGGLTIVMVSHDKDALPYASRVLRVADGAIAEERGGVR